MGRPRRRWENNIEMDVQKKGCEVTDWMELAQDREPSGSKKYAGNFLTC
jgi:hypothetical protein